MTVGIKSIFKKNQITLVEVLLASFIAATSMVAVYSAMLSARSASLGSRLSSVAQKIVQDKVQELSTLSYTNLERFAKENSSVINETISASSITSKELGDSMAYSADLSKYNGVLRYAVLQYPNSCEIYARVEWTSPDAGVLSTELSVFKYDLD